MDELGEALKEITGFSAISFQPTQELPENMQD